MPAAPRLHFDLGPDPLDGRRWAEFLGDPAWGARVEFTGVVRNHHAGRSVTGLDYEAFPELARREGLRLLTELATTHGLAAAICLHRTGSLQPGDPAVWVAVTSAHREAAFAGCRAIIDEVKARVPIWKRERYADGTLAWVWPGQSVPAAPC